MSINPDCMWPCGQPGQLIQARSMPFYFCAPPSKHECWYGISIGVLGGARKLMGTYVTLNRIQDNLENLLWAVDVATVCLSVCPAIPYALITTSNEYTIQRCLRLLRSILILVRRMLGPSPVTSQLIQANIQAVGRVGGSWYQARSPTEGFICHIE